MTVAVDPGSAHALGLAEIADRYEADPDNGLSKDDAAARLQEHGPNRLEEDGGRRLWRILLSQFQNPLIYVLLAAAAITLVIGQVVDSSVIMGVVIVNAIVGFIQEWRASLALAALSELTTTSATTIRGGRTQRIPSEEVVPGDLVVLEAGDRVPADLRLVRAHELQIDEANLTGESVPVHKHTEELSADTTLADRVNMAYSGTLVTAGNGAGLTVGTGSSTEMGRIHDLMESAEGVDTPLTRKLTRFSRWLTVIILGLAGMTFILGLVRGESAAEMVTAAVALAVGAIPEGLPAAVTITLAIGVSRMARRNAIVRQLPAVETLGSTIVICTDKTGTLTENRMTVQEIYCDGTAYELAEIGDQASPAVRDCLLAGVLCNDASVGTGITNRHDNVGDPTELALIAAAETIDSQILRQAQRWPRIQEIPFSSELRFMATLHTNPDDDTSRLIIKGAVEEVLAFCDDPDESTLLRETDELGSRALRVMGFAWVDVSSSFSLSLDSLRAERLSFLGLQRCSIHPERRQSMQCVPVTLQASP